MKIRMLGTGYGECKTKKFISKDYRRHGGVLLDSKVLIDAPADIFDLSDELGISDLLDGVTSVFISHSHKGHFDSETIGKLAKRKKISVFGSIAVLNSVLPSPNIERIPIKPYQPIDLGAYKIIPLPAPHRTGNTKEPCYNFLISADRNLLYSLDGSILRADYLWLLPLFKLDAVIMDTAEETKDVSKFFLQHGSFETNKMARSLMISLGAASDKTRFILSHIPTDRKRSVHEELTELAKNSCLTVAYDGYFFTI